MKLEERLHQKGWTSAEIEHALHHMNVAEQKKHPFVKFTDKSLYWLFLVSLILSISALSEIVFPFLAILPASLRIFLLVLLGAVFGALFAHILHTMDALHDAHHTIVLFVVLASTLISSWIVLGAQRLFGLVFVLCFAAAYIYRWKK